MPIESTHLNPSGLACDGRTCCAFCKRCDSCATITAGRALADFHSTPKAISPDRICDSCTRWLRDIEAIRLTSKAGQPTKRRRSKLAT